MITITYDFQFLVHGTLKCDDNNQLITLTSDDIKLLSLYGFEIDSIFQELCKIQSFQCFFCRGKKF